MNNRDHADAEERTFVYNSYAEIDPARMEAQILICSSYAEALEHEEFATYTDDRCIFQAPSKHGGAPSSIYSARMNEMDAFEIMNIGNDQVGTFKPTAALYVRATGTGPADLEESIEACAAFAVARGYCVGPTYVDAAGAGIRIGTRPGAAALVEAAGRGAFQAVVAEGVQGLSRSSIEALHLCLDLDRLGVELHTGEDGRIAVPSVLLDPMLAMAGARRMSDRMQAGRRRAAAEGRLPRTPYGYRRHPSKAGRHGIEPETAAVVRRIFDRLAEGASCATVARELSDTDVPPPSSPPLHGAPQWTARRVGAIRQDRVYVGEVVWGRTTSRRDESTGKQSLHAVDADRWIVSQRPDLAIVDRETWQRAAQSRRGK